MSDFLTNLTARSLGSVPNLLKPQLPSLFETPKGTASILAGEGSLNVHEEINEVTSTPPAATNRPRFNERRTEDESHASIPPIEARRVEVEHSRPALQTILPYEPPQHAEPSARIRPEARADAEPTVSVTKSSGEREQVSGPRVEAMTRPVEKIDPAEPSRNVEARLVPILPKMESAQQVHREDEPLPFDPGSQVVHISIGRIDVRAVMQPSAPARSAIPNRPTLTLDDYLLGRNEGRR